MNEQISKIKDELETTGGYELTMSRLLNEIILQNNSPEILHEELKSYQDEYIHYIDLLDKLKIDDDLLEVLGMLFDKINSYNLIKTLIFQLKHHNEVISTVNQIPHFKQVLNEIHKNSGITMTSLNTTVDVDFITLTQILNKASNLDLIICKSYPPQDVEKYYFLTDRGLTYINLLNKELGKND